MSHDPRHAMLACAGDTHGDVAAGALWLAAEDCSDVDVRLSLLRLEILGDELAKMLHDARGAGAVTVVHELLRSRLGLRRSGGADPRSHYLHTVLERGAGVPIICAAIWMSVGRRAGLQVEGIGLPGHFGVRVDGVFAEPVSGAVLDDNGIRKLVAAATGDPSPDLHPSWLLPASVREMLARMSRNLRGCYASLQRWELAFRAADRCVALLPDEPGERRDRGLLLFRAGRHGAALADLRQYLEETPRDAPDRQSVEEVAGRIRAALN